MAFGQQSGPPASAKEIQRLLTLLQEAGYSDFREARGAMGFNQRQGGGKFTRDEVATYIEQLETMEGASDGVAEVGSAPPRANPAEKLSSVEQALRRVPAEKLAAELQRRGWIVMEP
jgi:hypothetical protein